jgi:hypothetical protein
MTTPPASPVPPRPPVVPAAPHPATSAPVPVAPHATPATSPTSGHSPTGSPHALSPRTLVGAWVSGSNLVVGAGVATVINTNTLAIPAFALTLPANPAQEQTVTIITGAPVTSFTLMAGSGHTINVTVTQLAQHQCVRYMFIGTVWYRIHSG